MQNASCSTALKVKYQKVEVQRRYVSRTLPYLSCMMSLPELESTAPYSLAGAGVVVERLGLLALPTKSFNINITDLYK